MSHAVVCMCVCVFVRRQTIPEDRPVVLMNPELIDAGVVGFGLGELDCLEPLLTDHVTSLGWTAFASAIGH
jgi:hypothetical protein